MNPKTRIGVLTLPGAFALLVSAAASAQCLEHGWKPAGGAPGLGGFGGLAATTWDPDGPGPLPAVAVLGGSFGSAGDVVVRSIVTWDGQNWGTLGSGIVGTVSALTVYNGDLIAAGTFSSAGDVACANIARFDGQAWHSLGSGIVGSVYALAVYNGKLIAGGYFSNAGGVACNNVASWDGSTWAAMSTGFSPGVVTAAVYNSELYVGGYWGASGAIRRWNGSIWREGVNAIPR